MLLMASTKSRGSAATALPHRQGAETAEILQQFQACCTERAAYGFLLFHVERAVVAIAHRTVVTVRATQWEAHLEAFAQVGDARGIGAHRIVAMVVRCEQVLSQRVVAGRIAYAQQRQERCGRSMWLVMPRTARGACPGMLSTATVPVW